jgi:arginyl-tRNA synthetase
LAAVFNSLYGAEQFIVNGEILGSCYRLIQAFINTMSKGLHVLGIPIPPEM